MGNEDDLLNRLGDLSKEASIKDSAKAIYEEAKSKAEEEEIKQSTVNIVKGLVSFLGETK